MSAVLIIGAGYPLALALLVLIDWLSGWSISEAFGVPTRADDRALILEALETTLDVDATADELADRFGASLVLEVAPWLCTDGAWS